MERYLDVTRGEMLFARAVIFVEGDAERFLLPVLAKAQGLDLDELGIFVCSIAGTDFYPFLRLVGSRGLGMPFAALTDRDPRENKDDLGPNRVVNQMMWAIVDDEVWDNQEFADLLAMAPENGVFMNTHTLEVDLFQAGLGPEFALAIDSLECANALKKRMRDWADDPDSLEVPRFLADLNRIGKGRVAQRLAAVIAETGTDACPNYIRLALEHVDGAL